MLSSASAKCGGREYACLFFPYGVIDHSWLSPIKFTRMFKISVKCLVKCQFSCIFQQKITCVSDVRVSYVRCVLKPLGTGDLKFYQSPGLSAFMFLIRPVLLIVMVANSPHY